jgi:hypothetical protein
MNKNATVLAHNAGVFSLINKVVTCLGMYERVHVDFSRGSPCLYSTPGNANLWNYLFKATQPIDGASDEVIEYPDSSITYKNVATLYTAEDEWRQKYNLLWKLICPLESISLAASEFIERAFGDRPFVCAQVRANSHRGEQVSDKSQSLEDYAQAIRSVLGNEEPVYIACDIDETLEWFTQQFNPVAWFPATRRAKTRDEDYHLIEKQTFQDAINCLVEVIIMSRARVLIHPISNMATGALYINPTMKHIYLP